MPVLKTDGSYFSPMEAIEDLANRPVQSHYIFAAQEYFDNRNRDFTVVQTTSEFARWIAQLYGLYDVNYPYKDEIYSQGKNEWYIIVKFLDTIYPTKGEDCYIPAEKVFAVINPKKEIDYLKITREVCCGS